jgi:hypothetical protein
MVDILTLSATQQINEVNCCTSSQNTCVQSLGSAANTANSCVSAMRASGPYSSNYGNYDKCKYFIDNYPWCCSYWTGISTMSSVTGSVAVCDTSGNFRCGRCCSWTVPAGASLARFQLWGPGSSSGMGCCCGGAPPGVTGAYASVIIPVTPGDTYVLCAGCATCCYPCWSLGYQGGPSYVTGAGLCNFCAEGGNHNLWLWMIAVGRTAAQYRINIGVQEGSNGPCMCNSCADYCFSNSCGSCGVIGHAKAVNNYCGCTTVGSVVQGIPGIHPCGCFDSNHYGYWKAPPVYCMTAGCSMSWSSQSCGGCNCSAPNGGQPWAGSGGVGRVMMGGCNTTPGDAGRMGMVCVQYC